MVAEVVRVNGEQVLEVGIVRSRAHRLAREQATVSNEARSGLWNDKAPEGSQCPNSHKVSQVVNSESGGGRSFKIHGTSLSQVFGTLSQQAGSVSWLELVVIVWKQIRKRTLLF